MAQKNDKRCVGRNLLKTRRDAKILALELLSGESDIIIDALGIGVSVESDRDIELLSEELDKLCVSLKIRAIKLKNKKL